MTHEEFIGRYHYDPVKDRIGKGGFGSVYKARDTVRNRYVAVKESQVDEHKFTLQREVELSHEIVPHPNIAKFENCYRFTAMRITMDYAVMDYYPEGSLSTVLKNHSLPDSAKREIIEGVLRGIAHLHNEGVIHRDLKSGNILVKYENGHWIPQITDFGLSRFAENDASVSNSSIGISYAFAAPEQIRGQSGKVRKNIDLWAVGTVIYHIITGKLPFTAEGITDTNSVNLEISRKITNRILPSGFNTLPQPYRTMIDSCWTLEPAERVQQAEELLEMLENRKPVEDDITLIENNKQGKTETKPATGKTKTDNIERTATKAIQEPQTPVSNKKTAKKTIGNIAVVIVGLCLLWGIWSIIEKQITAKEVDIDIPMVHVAGGTFTMGCTGEQDGDCYDGEKPAHQVTLSDFYIGKYEVTQAQWKAVMGNNPSYFKGDNLPVEQVSWDDVQGFIWKLNQKTGKAYRLPTEAEWEYAARGGAQGKGYKYSGGNTVGDVAWYTNNAKGKTHPVGTKQANELGIYDMSGNVYEWCSDWYGAYYPAVVQTNPKGASKGSIRVGRGGGWRDDARLCRVSFRDSGEPDGCYYNLGFRLACSSM